LELDFTQNRFTEPWALAQFTAYALAIRNRYQTRMALPAVFRRVARNI
jgi:hypothetical protein